ncbi:ComEC/Rec2 family competence protein [Clostridium gasigenes]|uniref:ComEC/Rec2 family competence protein n=1 Tax=Clostridium gasigenes TaxID=94869 RepID=UPI00209A7250|nr:ComEC/Rec2 family competence protein [Clostridium gasigenes]
MILNEYKNIVNPMPYIFGMFILGTIIYKSFYKYQWLAIFIASCFFALIYFLKGIKITLIMMLFFVVAVINNSFYYNYTPGVTEQVTITSVKPYSVIGEINRRKVYLEGNLDKVKIGERILVRGEFISELEIARGNIGTFNIVENKKLKDNFTSKLYKIREKIFYSIKEKLGWRRASLVSSIAFGYTEFLDEDDKENMKSLGLLHAVSVSGLHMALVYGVLRKIFGRKYTPFIALLYVLFTGAALSTIRAYIMLLCTSLATPLRRNYNPTAGLSLAGVIILIMKPYGAFEIGFILSFLATLGIILFNKKLNKKLYKLPKFLREGLSLTLSAQILSFPVLVLTFKEFSFNFIIGNIILAPVISVIVLIGNLLVITWWMPFIFNYLCFITYYVTIVMDKIIDILEKFMLPIFYFNENTSFMYLILLMSGYFYKKGYKKIVYMPFIAIIYIMISIYSPIPKLKYYREGAYLLSYKGDRILITLKKDADFKRLEKICIANKIYNSPKNIKIGENIILRKNGDDFILQNLNKEYLLKRWREKNKSEYDIIDFSKGDFNEIIILKDEVVPLD